MKKLITITIAGMLLQAATYAQTRFGLNAGAAFSNYSITDNSSSGQTSNFKSRTGFTAGILVDVPLSNYLSLQPAANFVQKGFKDSETDNGTTLTASMNIDNLEIPLNLVINTSGSGNGLFIGAGPSVTFGLSGQWKVTDGTNSATQNVKFGSTADDDLKGTDLAVNFLAGFRFGKGLVISANYNLGLSNLTPVSSDGSMKSHYFGIKAGFLFGGTGKK